jgi:hypothetical protein
MTKNRILGAIGVLWGGGMLLARLARGAGDAAANEAYAAGQMVGLIFGALLFLVGLYYLIKG